MSYIILSLSFVYTDCGRKLWDPTEKSKSSVICFVGIPYLLSHSYHIFLSYPSYPILNLHSEITEIQCVSVLFFSFFTVCVVCCVCAVPYLHI